jgi:hypothetical protein
VSKLVEVLASELERPRELSPRVMNYIEGTYGIDANEVGAFLTDKLQNLEDYEVDLILSPLFTPRLSDQAIVAELLGRESTTREQWPDLTQQLLSRPARAQLVTPDGRAHAVILREVMVERYLHRLRLEGSISEFAFNRIRSLPAKDQPLLQAIARRAVWENGDLGSVLERYLAVATERGEYSLADALALLDLVEGRKPASLADLLARIPGWKEALRQQVEVGSRSKPFFHGNIEEMHGGGRDQRGPENERMSAKEMELAFLGRLEQILGTVA